MHQERKIIIKQPAFWVMCAAEQAAGKVANGHKLERHKTSARRDHRAHVSLLDNLSPDQSAYFKPVAGGPRVQARVCRV